MGGRSGECPGIRPGFGDWFNMEISMQSRFVFISYNGTFIHYDDTRHSGKARVGLSVQNYEYNIVQFKQIVLSKKTKLYIRYCFVM